MAKKPRQSGFDSLAALTSALGAPVASSEILLQQVPSQSNPTPEMSRDQAPLQMSQAALAAMNRDLDRNAQPAATPAPAPAPAEDYIARMYGPAAADPRLKLDANGHPILPPQDRHPGMPPSVANFNGRDIVNQAAAQHQAQRPTPGQSRTPTEGVYVPSGIKPAGGVRTGDPFLDVNTDFGALAADKAVKDANDRAFTQMNRGHMSGIAATREAANSDRNSRLQQMGKTPEEIERIMYPERFSDLRGEAMANVEGRAKPARMSQQAFDETNGRISATSRTDALMRKARLNGQSLPYAQAAGMARNDLPTTGPDTVGQASLPGMDPARLAAMDPRAGQVAAMMGLGTQRNANDAAAETGRQGLQRQQQDNSLIGTLLGHMIAQQQQDTNSRVALDNVNDPKQKEREAARTWLGTEAAMKMANSTDQNQRAFHANMLRIAAGQDAAPAQNPAQMGPVPTTGAPAPGAPAQAAMPTTEQFLASNQDAMNAHLAKFTDPTQRRLEEARIRAATGYVDPLDDMMKRFRQDDPNLAWGPDHWQQSYGGGRSITNWLFGQDPIHERAAKYAQEHYGIPYDLALPRFQDHYSRM